MSRPSLKSLVFTLVCAVALPILLLAVYGLWRAYTGEMDRASRLLLDQTTAMALQVDADFARAEQALRILEASGALQSGERAAWERAKRGVEATLPGGRVDVLADTPAAPGLAPAHARALAAPGQIAWSDLQTTDTPSQGEVLLYLAVTPASPADALRTLRLAVSNQLIGRVLRDERFAQGRVAAVLDRQQILVDRAVRPEALVGRPATAPVVDALQTRERGVMHNLVNQDNRRSVVAFATAPRSRFAVVTAVPDEEFGAPLRAGIARTVALGGAVMLLALAASAWGLRRLTRALDRVAQAQQTSRTEPTGLRETDVLAERVAHTARERDAALREKDHFLGVVSHEMRSPLSAILGWCRVMALDNASIDMQRRGLQAIERNAMAQVRLVDDLIDLTRIGSGKLELQCTPVLLADAVDAAVESCTPAAEAKALVIDWQHDRQHDGAAAVRVHGDAARLTQVAWNLIGNAIKFSPAGECIVVRLSRSDGEARLAVQDRGIGIEPSLLPHIFEPFRQADDTPASRLGGLGLGLTIARTIVELHGGTINAHSDGAGRGATVTVTLPLRSDAANEAQPQAKGLPQLRLQGG
jgi:signal transduction histidine kinase